MFCFWLLKRGVFWEKHIGKIYIRGGNTVNKGVFREKWHCNTAFLGDYCNRRRGGPREMTLDSSHLRDNTEVEWGVFQEKWSWTAGFFGEANSGGQKNGIGKLPCLSDNTAVERGVAREHIIGEHTLGKGQCCSWARGGPREITLDKRPFLGDNIAV